MLSCGVPDQVAANVPFASLNLDSLFAPLCSAGCRPRHVSCRGRRCCRRRHLDCVWPIHFCSSRLPLAHSDLIAFSVVFETWIEGVGLTSSTHSAGAMQQAAQLVRAVLRAFYTDEHCAVVEALLRPPYYLLDDNTTRSPMGEALGGLHALKARQLLRDLHGHSLVYTFVDGGNTYWYIDFVHFVKVVHLRMWAVDRHIESGAALEAVHQSPEYKCPRCGSEFTAIDALEAAFVCTRDGTKLEGVRNAPSTSAASVEPAARAPDLKHKFEVQTSAAHGLRDGIRELLAQLNAAADEVPENHPLARIHAAQQELRAREEQLLGGDRRGAAGAPGDDILYAQELGIDSRRDLAREPRIVPEFLHYSSVTGELTEEGLRAQAAAAAQSAARARMVEGEDDQYLRTYSDSLAASVAVNPAASRSASSSSTASAIDRTAVVATVPLPPSSAQPSPSPPLFPDGNKDDGVVWFEWSPKGAERRRKRIEDITSNDELSMSPAEFDAYCALKLKIYEDEEDEDGERGGDEDEDEDGY